jgi:glycosyltransferase involved in cell wall biosynthesis
MEAKEQLIDVHSVLLSAAERTPERRAMTISVITPTRDRGSFIETAINSVISQSMPAFEHIVIDGASRDDTLSRLKRFPHLEILSEPDRGLYDAINKGIGKARGDVICILNSDDQLLPGAFDSVSAAFISDPDADAVCGRVRIGEISNTGEEVEIGSPAMQSLRAGDVISGLPITNGRFFRRRVFELLDPFDQAFPILADRDFLGRLLLKGLRTRPIDRAVYRYGRHRESLSFGSGAGQLSYNNEAINLALTRLEQSSAESERALYRRWLGWAIGYALVRGLNTGRFKQVWRATVAARSRLKYWPLEFAAQAAWHLSTRAERRGRAA